MSIKLEEAVQELLETLQNQINQVSETKRAINVLHRTMGKGPMFPDEAPERLGAMKIRPDQFYGRPLATSVQEFLELRKRATGEQACDVSEILKALEEGGFDFKAAGWRDTDRLRPLSISIAKNTKVFHRLPNGMFGLLVWYPEVGTTKRERPEKVFTTAAETEEVEGGNANAA
jgi:hypothetical protein